MSLACECEFWEANIEKINGPIVLQQIRQPHNPGIKPFLFCPWCSEALHEVESVTP